MINDFSSRGVEMYLKKLDVQGFKSFPDKLSLEFSNGITSIVGPNGSGKSNIADAVRWVLGEQSIKTLRGSKLEDIIFSGTEHRKPMGFSEVSVTIDNSDGILPVEYSEVKITRRIFRSGESEFYINNTSCRLKDIYSLLLDTGIGRDGYSIIGQGRIDEILSSRSEDRRNIFEEASGIMKFKVRKNEAERKLKSTSENLVRINDIINELENQIEPLKEQSTKARKYLDLRENLKTLEVNLYIMNIDRYNERLKEYDRNQNELENDITNEMDKLVLKKNEKQQNSKRFKELEGKMETVRSQYYDLEGRVEKCNSQIRINEEKLKSMDENIKRIESESNEDKEKITRLTEERQDCYQKRKRLEQQREDNQNKLHEYQAKMEEIVSTLDESEISIEKLKTSMDEKNETLSDKKIQENNILNRIIALNDRKSGLEREIEGLQEDIAAQSSSREELVESTGKAEAGINELINKRNIVEKQKQENNEKLDQLRKEHNEMKSQLQIKTSRYRLLEDMEENLEGYRRSVRNLLLACERNEELGKGIHGALAQLITVKPEYENAVEMSLGGAIQNVVTEKEEDAKRAIRYLKKNKLGRVTFLPVSSIRPSFVNRKTKEGLKSSNGFIGMASELTDCQEKISDVISSLLGRVAIFDNIDNAVNAARKFSYSLRIATLDGDVINTSGSISGGSREKSATGILGRHREITELKKEVSKIRQNEEKLQNELSVYIKALEENERILQEIRNELKDNELVKIRDESHIAKIDKDIEKDRAKLEMMVEEKKQVEEEINSSKNELTGCRQHIDSVQLDIKEALKKIEQHRSRYKKELSSRDAISSDITELKISINSLNEGMDSVRDVIRRIETGIKELNQSLNVKELRKTKDMEIICEIKESNEGIKKQLSRYTDEKTGRNLELDRIGEEKQVINEEMESMEEEIKEIDERITDLKEQTSRIQVRKARTESELESVQNRLWDDYELTYGNSMQYRKNIGSVASAQRDIDALKEEIKDLGPVNVQALEEYIKTKERFEFMTEQKTDMEKAQEKLKKVIYRMTSIMKKKFIQQFKLINKNFNLVFKDLFRGGRAELKLTDDINVLESGIEIEVQPPGKKLQNMMLLSGGERALTAIALLFAIIKLNPTPFCILDEIEASLDDANVYIFAEYLRGLCDDTQFIMVTHRKGTMEASDTLYGVTMEERGVSKTVSIRMEQAREAG